LFIFNHLYLVDDNGFIPKEGIMKTDRTDIRQWLVFSIPLILMLLTTMEVASADDQSALGMSRWVFGRDRLGQIVSKNLSEDAVNYLSQNRKLIIVNATDTSGADSGNGHAYFRKSPSTSSDILTTLMFDLKPEERGLEQTGGRPIWTFSTDYIDRLRAALLKARAN
jgi:hypothetical protein